MGAYTKYIIISCKVQMMFTDFYWRCNCQQCTTIKLCTDTLLKGNNTQVDLTSNFKGILIDSKPNLLIVSQTFEASALCPHIL